jgi:hypothetical protein
MINTTVFSQRDPRWRYDKLGFSKLTIGGYGCVITCLAMLLKTFGYDETPRTVNQKLKKVNGFSGALLRWSYAEKVWPRLRFVKRATRYNNIEVAWYVYVKKIPVIVQTYAPKIGASVHWVLYIGDRYMLDPWDGKGKPTQTYSATAYALYNTC